MTTPHPISLRRSIADLEFLSDRTPETTHEQSAGAFGRLADYRDGGVFVAHWAGRSEWERHPVGDEIVMVIGGATTITFLDDGAEASSELRENDVVVVPQGIWHRFETPDRVELLAVTPQPTEHSVARPE